jgi:hypothetical protein
MKPVDEKLRRYKPNYLQHVKGMKNHRMPKLTLDGRPN